MGNIVNISFATYFCGCWKDINFNPFDIYHITWLVETKDRANSIDFLVIPSRYSISCKHYLACRSLRGPANLGISFFFVYHFQGVRGSRCICSMNCGHCGPCESLRCTDDFSLAGLWRRISFWCGGRQFWWGRKLWAGLRKGSPQCGIFLATLIALEAV